MIFVRISATVIVQADQPATIPPQVLDHHHHPEPMMMTTDLPSAPPLELEESDLDFRFLVFTVYKIGLQHTILYIFAKPVILTSLKSMFLLCFDSPLLCN